MNGAEHDLWMGRVTIAPGTRRSVYGRTKSETLQKMRAALSKAEQGMPQGDSRTTVGTFLTEWLEGPAARSVRPSTLAAYRHYVTRHLVPALGRHRLVSLRPEHIDALLTSLGSGPEPLSPRTLQQIRAILRSALSWAERNGRVSRNVAKLSVAPRVTRSAVSPLTAVQARKLVRAVQENPAAPDGALYVLALDTGMRQGELLGLRWDDVDMEGRVLQVVQTRQATRGSATFGVPKSDRSRRTVAFSGLSADLLRDHRGRQSEQRLRLGRDWKGVGLVFTRADGSPLDGSTVTHRFQQFLARHGLPRQRFHDLRHASASFLLMGGLPARAVADRLGHSTVRLTLDTYAHLGADTQHLAAAEMERVLAGDADSTIDSRGTGGS